MPHTTIERGIPLLSDGPPNFEPGKLDFSRFHPLDHTVWQCRGYPGGIRKHLDYRWSLQWYPGLRRRTLCRAGTHRPVCYWGPDGDTGMLCRDCSTLQPGK
jgi:hypothetical protein